MFAMAVTLDVSQLSGWLNAAAFCRVKGKHVREEGRHVGPGDGRGVWGRWRRKQRAQGGSQLRRLCWQGTRGAHRKHVLHECDAGRVPAQRLVERLRVLPRRKGSVWKEGRHVGPGEGKGVGPAAAQAACREYPNCGGCAGRGTRGAHVKHGQHGSDAGRIPAQRLVERPIVLPRRTGSICGKRGGMWGRATGGECGAGGGASSGRREDPNCGGCAGRARAERTVNMYAMVVTLDVSKFSGWLNAAARCRVEREQGKRGGMWGRATGGERGAAAAQAACAGRIPTAEVVLAGHARSARKTCHPWLWRWTCSSSAAG